MKHCIDKPHDIPSPENFDLGHFSKSALTTYTCNKATKYLRVMEEKVTDREKELSCNLSYFKLE